jgi:hypothetical protein
MQRARPTYYQNRQETPEVKIVASFLKGIWLIFSWPFRRFFKTKARTISGLDRERVKTKWEEISALMKMGKPSNFKTAVLEADKLLNYVMGVKGAEGETIADRLRSFREKFSDYSGVWQAHILRNKIVHEIETEVFIHEAREAIAQFKKALIDLGAL